LAFVVIVHVRVLGEASVTPDIDTHTLVVSFLELATVNPDAAVTE